MSFQSVTNHLIDVLLLLTIPIIREHGFWLWLLQRIRSIADYLLLTLLWNASFTREQPVPAPRRSSLSRHATDRAKDSSEKVFASDVVVFVLQIEDHGLLYPHDHDILGHDGRVLRTSRAGPDMEAEDDQLAPKLMSATKDVLRVDNSRSRSA